MKRRMKTLTAAGIGILCMLALVVSQVQAQNFARISGRITDEQTGDYLPGANVMLEGTTLGAASDRFGYYRINRVPPGTYTLKVTYIGYETYTTTVKVEAGQKEVKQDVALKMSVVQMEGIVVQGLLEGQMRALSQQMTAPDIRNVLAREEMERFPDMNTAEVLQRVPGVAIQRSLGEGRFVYLRGTEPRLTTVTLNGEKLASPQDEERFIGLDVINADQLSFIEVVKALTPDMDGDAIGGTVNLVTRTAFDYDRPVFKLDLGSGYSKLPQKPLYRGSLTYSNIFGANDNIGLTVNASWYRNSIGSHSDEMDWGNQEDVNGNPIPFALEDVRFFNYITNRDHLGISGELEYRLNSNNRLFIRAMYNQRDDDQIRNMVRVRVKKGDYLSATQISKARMAYELQARNEVQKIQSYAFGGVHTLGSADLDYSLSYSYADETKKNPGQYKSEWQLNQKVDLSLDLSNPDFPRYTITNLDPEYPLDPVNWEIDNQDFRETFTSNQKILGQFNFKVPYQLGGYAATFKAGGKFHLQKKDRDSQRFKYKWKGSEDILMSRITSRSTIEDFLLGNYTFGPVVSDISKYEEFFNQYRGLDDGLRESIKRADTDGEGGKYTATEDIYALYGMTTVNMGALQILAGARVEITKTTYDGNELLFDENGDFLNIKPVNNENSYTNVFPAVHFRYRMTPRTNLRLAVTTGISRPNYFDLAPYRWVFPEDREILQGNPELLPTTSTNFDVMFEHYFRGIGAIAAGFFYKALDKVSYNRIYQQVGGPYDGFFIEQPVNGGKAKLYGFEISWMQQFTFLPGFLSGLGIYANYTYTKSKADLLYRDWDVLPGQAGDVGNIGLNYEKYGLTARLSLNYNGALLYQVGATPDFDRYTDEHLQLDFSANYELARGINLYLELVNITNEPRRDYWGVKSRPRMNEYYSFWMRAGIKYTMQ
ncbi:MAG: TonB-dependent receptor [candidate division KSB1 bacterium]|nr:TonB-dependent receptor [candidate division KSB1 bacterium]